MLRVDYQELETAAKTLSEQGNIFEDCVAIMTEVINGLPDIWEADTCTAYVAEFAEHQTLLKEVRQWIEDKSAQMLQISHNFEQSDADMAAQM